MKRRIGGVGTGRGCRWERSRAFGAITLLLYLMILALPATVAMIPAGAGGGAPPGETGDSGGAAGDSSPGPDGEDSEGGGPHDPLAELVERFTNALSMAAEARDRALAQLGQAMATLTPREAAELRDALEEAAAGSERGRRTLQEVEAAFREAEKIDPDRLEFALRAGVLVSDVDLLGDPVHPSSGALHHQEREFALPIGETFFDLSRLHRSDQNLGSLFGSAWIAPFESFAFFSHTRRVEVDETRLIETKEELQSAIALLEGAARRFGGVQPALVRGYFGGRQLAVEAAVESGSRATSLSEYALSLLPPLRDPREARQLLDSSRAILTRARELLGLHEAERRNGEELLRLIPLLEEHCLGIDAALREVALYRAYQRWSDERSSEAARRDVPEEWRAIGGGVIGLIDETGTLLLYRASRGPREEGLDPLGFVLPGEALPLGKQTDTLTVLPDGGLLRQRRDGTSFEYDQAGRLLSRRDRNGIGYTLEREASRIVVQGSYGRRVILELTETGHQRSVSAVRAPDGATWRYEYGEEGELLTSVNPDGATYRYRYTGGEGRPRRLSTVVKPDGSELSLSYDLRGRVAELTDEEGRRQEFRYDDEGRRFTFRDRRGGETTLLLNERGLPVERRTPTGALWRFGYDREGRLRSRVGPTGEREEWWYTEEGLLSRHTLPTGVTVRYEYDDQRRIASVTDGPRGGARYRYDSVGNLRSILGAWGSRRFDRDTLGRPTAMLDALGNRWRYRYGPHGRVSEIVQPDGSSRRFGYDLMGRLVSFTDEGGNTISLRYDAVGQLTRIEEPDGGVQRRYYNSRGDMIRRTARDGRETEYVYDRTHRLLEERLPDGRVIGRTFDGEGALLSITVDDTLWRAYSRDPEGNLLARYDALLDATVAISRDHLGRPTHVEDGEGAVSILTYYPDGALESFSSATGGTTRFGRDRWGRLTYELDPLGGRWSARRDEAGRITLLRSPLGGERRYSYDAEGRLVSFVDELGGEHRFERDWRGQITGHRTPSGTTWRYRYDRSGRIVERVSPEGRTERYDYDSLGRLTSVQEGDYEPRRFAYDTAGRLSQERVGEARWRLEYDPVGRLVRATDPDGAVRSYDYDSFDRLKGISTPAGAMRRTDVTGRSESWSGTATYRITRDRRGEVTHYVDPDGVRFHYDYDDAGRLTTITSGGELVLSLERDGMGRPVRLGYDDGSVEARRYDSEGRLLESRHTGGVRKRFRYDMAGRLVALRVGEAPWVTRRYDAEGNLTAEGGSAGGGRRFEYDRDGLLVAARRGRETTRYEYDGGGRLRSVEYAGEAALLLEHRYDKGGALLGYTIPALRLSVDRELTPGGRVRALSVNGAPLLRLEYESAGREVSREIVNIGAQRSFYDSAGRLAGVVWQPRGGASAVGVVYDYTEAGRLSGELSSDGTGKFYRYRSDGLLESTRLLLPEGLTRPLSLGTPSGSHHESYASLRRRLGELLPRQPRATLPGRSWVETSYAAERYPYGRASDRPAGFSGEFERGPLGQIRTIRTPGGEFELIDGALGRLRNVRSREGTGEESRFFFYPGPEALYPILTHAVRAARRPAAPPSEHRHKVGAVIEGEGFSPGETKGPEATRELLGPGREEWTLLLRDQEFPALYLRFGVSDGRIACDPGSGQLFGVVRDQRGSPLWRFDEHTGITQKWLYSASGSCIMGEVDTEAALGFAAGTNAGPLLRLGYRFYDPAAGHFTMADPSGRDLHPTRYAGGDPVNFVDPWGLEQYNMMGFDRQNERLYVQIWDDRKPNRPVRVLNYGATNRVLTPEQRNNVPVEYDPDIRKLNDEYRYFPTQFPDSPPAGWKVHSPYVSQNPQVGPALRTDAERIVETYSRAPAHNEGWVVDGAVVDSGYYIHGGVGTTTWGCMRMANEDLEDLQDVVEAASNSQGYSRLHTISKRN